MLSDMVASRLAFEASPATPALSDEEMVMTMRLSDACVFLTSPLERPA